MTNFYALERKVAADGGDSVQTFYFNQQSEYWVLYELMCWLANVMRSPPARRSLVSSIIIDSSFGSS
jgi:hypothetical protein